MIAIFKVKIGQQQHLAECALPLLLAKGSAGKQSDKALYLLDYSVLKVQHLLAVFATLHLLAVLKALYLLAVSVLKVQPTSLG